MAKSMTTSVRLPNQLIDQLERASASMHRGKNWIIVKALEEYLSHFERQVLKSEAKRQSILASEADVKNETWDNDTDTSGWI